MSHGVVLETARVKWPRRIADGVRYQILEGWTGLVPPDHTPAGSCSLTWATATLLSSGSPTIEMRPPTAGASAEQAVRLMEDTTNRAETVANTLQRIMEQQV
jgi:hypothetical protein